MASNQIGDEGAKALANNQILISLHADNNPMGNEWIEKLKQTIKCNQQQMFQRRAQFIQILVILSRDKANLQSQSLLARLPKEILLHIIRLINFRATASIGKSAQQIYDCVKFMLENISILNQLLFVSGI